MHGHRISNENTIDFDFRRANCFEVGGEALYAIAAMYEKLRLCIWRKMSKILDEFRCTKARFALCCRAAQRRVTLLGWEYCGPTRRHAGGRTAMQR
jgi:hypothetical protein